MVELKNLSYKIKENNEEKVILKDINLRFPKGKITCITGHNGSGKSTLIKLIMGILNPTSGEIYFDEKNISQMSVTDRAKLGITLAFQQPVRFKGISVRDLIGIALKSQDTQPTVAEVCKYLSVVGLCAKDYIDRQLDDTLSGGELKRIEIALALAKGGEVFLFDEPEAGIDLWSFDSLVDVLKSLEGKTVVIVSHQKKVLENADYILLLDESQNAELKESKQVDSLLSKPQCGKLGGKNE